MANYKEFVQRAIRQHGAKFSEVALDKRFVPFYENGQRIKVRFGDMELTGTVGVTTGWRPCFLLMRTSRSMGSIWTLENGESIIAVQRGGKYIPVEGK